MKIVAGFEVTDDDDPQNDVFSGPPLQPVTQLCMEQILAALADVAQNGSRYDPNFVETTSLPPLPAYLNTKQEKGDRLMGATRPIPAVVFLYDTHGTLLGSFGDPNPTTSFRFNMNNMITFPTFMVQVRLDRTGVQPEDNRYDSLEIDPDYCTDFTIRMCQPNDADVSRLLHGKTGIYHPGKVERGLVEWSIKPGARPQWTYQVIEGFPNEGPQTTFRHILHKARSFKAVVFLPPKSKNSDYGANFKTYIDITKLRKLSGDDVERNDWWLSRSEDYDTTIASTYHKFVAQKSLSIPVWPWLATIGGHINQAYDPGNLSAYQPPRLSFPSVKMYASHFMPALLMERDESVRALRAQFNRDMMYPAMSRAMGEDHCLVHVMLKSDGSGRDRATIIPSQGTACRVWFDGYQGHYDMITCCIGKVCGTTHVKADFTIDVELSETIRRAGFNAGLDAECRVTLIFDEVNVDIDLKLGVMQKIQHVGFTEHKENKDLTPSFWEYKTRGYLELCSIISEPRRDLWSPDFQWDFECVASPANVTRAHVCIKDIVRSARLNDEQMEFWEHAMTGAQSNVLILEGLPGTGKSATLAAVVSSLLALDVKVLATSQSNAGVTELFDKIKLRLLSNDSTHHLIDGLIHVHSATMEKSFSNRLGTLPTGVSGIDEYSATARIDSYVKNNPQSRAVMDYRVNVLNGAGVPGGKNGAKYYIEQVEHELFGKTSLIACTTFVSNKLRTRGFQADVVILDEAAQATELDTILPLCDQNKIRLVILAGDTKQLWPVVVSVQARTNAFGNVLETPTMMRLVRGYPTIPRHTLVQSYRSHPSLLNMPSAMFYDKKLVPAKGLSWDTHLAGKVKGLLTTRAIFGKAIKQSIVERDNRQFFFDVNGMPEHGDASFSWFNANGDTAVIHFLKMLTSGAGIPQDKIGIISMYKDDRNKLRVAAEQNRLGDVKIATVDAFQGREKHIMLVHFVAAMKDSTNPFGFTAQANRLCVATTRAKEYEFFFGNLSFWAMRMEGLKSFQARYPHMARMVEHVKKEMQVVKWQDVDVRGM